MAIHHSDEVGRRDEYFCYIGERFLDVFVEQMDEILCGFATFLRQIMITKTNDQKKNITQQQFVTHKLKNLI